MLKRIWRGYWYELILLLIMSLLVLVNLDWRYFAADESYNVTMGQYILKNNWVPKVWDGKNLITTINGNDFNENLICINLNYGAYYITALAQLIFGKNTYLIRLPFALMGIFSSVVWYKYFNEITNKRVARLFLLFYCLSIPVIIYVRNANYFAPSLLFMGLMYWYYVRATKDNKRINWIMFIVFSFIQFHINYMLFVFTIIPILFDCVITKKITKSFLISYLVTFVLTFPFFVWMRYNFYLLGSSYRSIVKMDFLTGYYRFIEQIWHILFYIAPVIPLVPIVFVVKFIHRKKRTDHTDGMIDAKGKSKRLLYISVLITILFNFLFLSFLTFEFETRYYLAIFPFLFFLLALLLNEILKKDYIVSMIIIVLLLFTNVINMIPYNITKLFNANMNDDYLRLVIASPIPSSYMSDANYSLDTIEYTSYFYNYVSTFYLPIKDEVCVLMEYLEQHASPGDTITTFGTDSWTNAIQYYTDLRLVNNLRKEYGSWSYDDYYPNVEKFYRLVYYPDEMVDWAVYPFSLYGSEKLFDNFLDPLKYERILLKKNTDGMSNDIWLYCFGPEDEISYFVIFKKIE